MTPRVIPQSTTASVNHSRKIKRLNALTAVLSGGVSGLVLCAIFPITLERLFLGFLAGLIWANGFEYVYHRWVLHMAGSLFARRHMVHHRATGTPEEAEHLTFGESPLWIVFLFLINGLPIFVADRILGLGVYPGMLIAFSVYFVAVEEIHWRIHLGESLPGILEPARKFHLQHHDRPDARYNVFFPLFDWLLGTSQSRTVVPRGETRPLA